MTGAPTISKAGAATSSDGRRASGQTKLPTVKQSRDRLWFKVHSWLGLKLSLLMTFVLATGTIAVFSAEIDWLITPEMRATERVAQEDIAWGAAFDTWRREYPNHRPISINRHQDNWFSLYMILNTPWRENVLLWLDPPNGEMLGVTSFYNVQRFFRNTHRHLMMPVNIGIPIVTFLAFPLLISLVAGFVVYKKFWRGFFKRPRFERKTRIWNGDLHRLAGLWGSWFIALIALTSVWYFVEVFGGRAPPFPPPKSNAVSRESSLPADFDGDDLEVALARAQQRLPGLEVRRILFPANRNGSLLVQGDLTAALVRPRANAVYIDPSSLQVTGSYRGEELGLHTRISEASDPLHFGYFGGIASKLIWFVFGVMMTTMAITGIAVYSTRLRPAKSAARVAPPKNLYFADGGEA